MIEPGIVKQLQRLKGELYNRYGVVKIGFFDCFISHHHNALCDLNVLVELERPLGWQYFALKEYIEEKLEIHIDIFTAKALKPSLREEILSKIQYA